VSIEIADLGNDAHREFEGAFDRLWPRCRMLAARLLGPADADDIAAEAMARLWAHWPRVGRADWVDGWALRVTTNLAIDRARRRARTDAPRVSEDPSDAAVLRLALTAALAKLPRRQREAVTLRYLTDLSEVEVAHALGISAGSVKTHLHRGLATLRMRLGPDFSELNHGI
jgi:RNA polymerase sigma-70 factor (ECF subfamily)